MRAAWLVALVASLGVGMVTPARAECGWVTVTRTHAVSGHFVVETEKVWRCDNDPAAVATSGPSEETIACREQATEMDLEPDFCVNAQQAQASDPVITPALVLEALSRLPLPPSELVIQPPNGRTIVNFDTNFYTVREPFTRAVRLLGQRVDLRIFPTAFTWRFDDGPPRTTNSPGAPYPDLEVTHNYLTKDTFAPSVDTTYGADWRVGGDAWQPVPGTVTIAGDPVPLETVEVRPKLVFDY